MFDLPGIKEMGQSIETFTTETHAGLLDIAMQLRITNALLAMLLSEMAHTEQNERDHYREAFSWAASMAAEE